MLSIILFVLRGPAADRLRRLLPAAAGARPGPVLHPLWCVPSLQGFAQSFLNLLSGFSKASKTSSRSQSPNRASPAHRTTRASASAPRASSKVDRSAWRSKPTHGALSLLLSHTSHLTQGADAGPNAPSRPSRSRTSSANPTRSSSRPSPPSGTGPVPPQMRASSPAAARSFAPTNPCVASPRAIRARH